MHIDFFKYNSNGNNFTKESIQRLCSRQFCIDADGVVLVQNYKGGLITFSKDENFLKLTKKPTFAFKGSTNFFD
jgi:hypothetical protein